MATTKDAAAPCAACSQPFRIGQTFMTANGNRYHPKCFACTSCRTLLGSSPFTASDGGQILCSSCARHAPSSTDTGVCARCGMSLGSKSLLACGRRWHAQCFLCTACEGPIDAAEFILLEDKPFCCEVCASGSLGLIGEPDAASAKGGGKTLDELMASLDDPSPQPARRAVSARIKPQTRQAPPAASGASAARAEEELDELMQRLSPSKAPRRASQPVVLPPPGAASDLDSIVAALDRPDRQPGRQQGSAEPLRRMLGEPTPTPRPVSSSNPEADLDALLSSLDSPADRRQQELKRKESELEDLLASL